MFRKNLINYTTQLDDLFFDK